MKLRCWTEWVRERLSDCLHTARTGRVAVHRRSRATARLTVEELEDRTLLSVLTEQSVFPEPVDLDGAGEYSTSLAADAGLEDGYGGEELGPSNQPFEISVQDSVGTRIPSPESFGGELASVEVGPGSEYPSDEPEARGGTDVGRPDAKYVPGQILVKLKTIEVLASLADSAAPAAATADASPNESSDPVALALTAIAEATGAQAVTPVFENLAQGDVADRSTVPLQPDDSARQDSEEPLAVRKSIEEDLVDASAQSEASDVTSQSKATPVRPEPTAELDWSDLTRWYSVELPTDADVEAAVRTVLALPQVEVAEPNYLWRATTMEIPPVIEGLPNATTDPAFDEQWHLINAKIAKAWDYLNHNGVYPGGSHDVVVAVIDTGVDYTHEELAANMWVNPGEIPNNNIDDDGNGIVDDVYGANFVSNPSLHNGDPMDPNGHGTHVAGIIAAQAFNGLGGVGTAFNVQIMAVRAGQYSGTFAVQDVAEAIQYAVSQGADVINMSFGGYQESALVEDALEVALNTSVLVAAAGNDGVSLQTAPEYPAAYPWVLGVMASTPDNKLAWFSNTGYEIAAPGDAIFSTLPGNQYAAWSGTSMAAPVVSGIAALMRSYYWQRDVYSSRFIMGSIAASGEENGGVVDAYKALTEPPQPGVDRKSVV